MALSRTEEYLLDFHARRPGATSHCFGDARTDRNGTEFDSPYACLADVVPRDGKPLSVFDLACGDGFLLADLASRKQIGLTLTGVDMSAAELDIARIRLGDSAALVCERAQALSATTGSIDIVLSHMALMLMDDVETCIGEVRRILKSGGIFSAVLGSGLRGSEVFEIWIGLLKPAMQQDGFNPVRFGDVRTRSETGLRELFDCGFSSIEVHELDVVCDAGALDLWDWFAQTYDVDQLSSAAQDDLRTAFLSEVAPLAGADGLIPCIDRLRQLVAVAK